jgi:hypothetical protein
MHRNVVQAHNSNTSGNTLDAKEDENGEENIA